MEVGDAIAADGFYFEGPWRPGDTVTVASVDRNGVPDEFLVTDLAPRLITLTEGSTFSDPKYLWKIPRYSIIERDGRRYSLDYDYGDGYLSLISMNRRNVIYIEDERKDNVTYTLRLLPIGVSQVEV